MQVRCWPMEWRGWSILQKPVAQMMPRESMAKKLLESLTNQPALLSSLWASVWWCPQSAVSSCLNSP